MCEQRDLKELPADGARVTKTFAAAPEIEKTKSKIQEKRLIKMGKMLDVEKIKAKALQKKTEDLKRSL